MTAGFLLVFVQARAAEVTLGPLHATLTLPPGDAPVPAVLILAGSGPTDRDGNQLGLRNDSLRLLAEGLASCGIASLRPDKRGVAASAAAAAREDALRFDTYVADAVAWLGFLAAQPRIARVDLLGHSEGALVATIAAQRATTGGAPVGHLVLIAGLGRPAGTVLREQLATLPDPLRTRAGEVVTALEQGRTVPDPPPALAALFRPGVQPYLISWFRLDPSAELSRTRMPALVVQGTTDLQVTLADARGLAAARERVTLDVIDGMNHVLRAAPPGRAANLATYGDPAAPLMPGLVDRICRFLAVP